MPYGPVICKRRERFPFAWPGARNEPAELRCIALLDHTLCKPIGAMQCNATMQCNAMKRVGPIIRRLAPERARPNHAQHPGIVHGRSLPPGGRAFRPRVAAAGCGGERGLGPRLRLAALPDAHE